MRKVPRNSIGMVRGTSTPQVQQCCGIFAQTLVCSSQNRFHGVIGECVQLFLRVLNVGRFIGFNGQQDCADAWMTRSKSGGRVLSQSLEKPFAEIFNHDRSSHTVTVLMWLIPRPGTSATGHWPARLGGIHA